MSVMTASYNQVLRHAGAEATVASIPPFAWNDNKLTPKYEATGNTLVYVSKTSAVEAGLRTGW